jgi:hypothetical protein
MVRVAIKYPASSAQFILFLRLRKSSKKGVPDTVLVTGLTARFRSGKKLPEVDDGVLMALGRVETCLQSCCM